MVNITEIAVVSDLATKPSKPNSFVRLVKGWVYRKFVSKPAKMPNVRWNDTNSSIVSCRFPRTQTKQLADDGTVKLSVGNIFSSPAECVFIPKPRGQGTACVSVQIGCPVKCRFCETGKVRRIVNLRPSEILGQLLCFGKLMRFHKQDVAHRVRTVVLMGMGEPLLNYNSTVVALKELVKQGVFSVSRRNIILSTVGIAPQIRRLCSDFFVVLAVSLHSSIDVLRSSLVPINRHKISEMLQVCEGYVEPVRLPSLTFEYCLISGVNDFAAEAHHLSCLMKLTPCKLNLIPLNTPATSRSFRSPSRRRVSEFCGVLLNNRVCFNVRKARGSDISASCGQLTREYR